MRAFLCAKANSPWIKECLLLEMLARVRVAPYLAFTACAAVAVMVHGTSWLVSCFEVAFVGTCATVDSAPLLIPLPSPTSRLGLPSACLCQLQRDGCLCKSYIPV